MRNSVFLVEFQQTSFSVRTASLKLTQPDNLACVSQSGIAFHTHLLSPHQGNQLFQPSLSASLHYGNVLLYQLERCIWEHLPQQTLNAFCHHSFSLIFPPHPNFMPSHTLSSSAIHPTQLCLLLQFSRVFPSSSVHATSQTQPQSKAGILQGPAFAFCMSSSYGEINFLVTYIITF